MRDPAGPQRSDHGSTYRRSQGSPRAQDRRRELLARVTDDLQQHGLTDFSLRRAARAAGTTHKVLLYHFADGDALLAEAVATLRERRIAGGLAAALTDSDGSLIERLRAIWPVLTGEQDAPLAQAMGLAMYDPARYAALAEGASRDYLAALQAICPAEWTETRRSEVATLILATLRGLLLARRTGGVGPDPTAGWAALERALARELAADA